MIDTHSDTNNNILVLISSCSSIFLLLFKTDQNVQYMMFWTTSIVDCCSYLALKQFTADRLVRAQGLVSIHKNQSVQSRFSFLSVCSLPSHLGCITTSDAERSILKAFDYVCFVNEIDAGINVEVKGGQSGESTSRTIYWCGFMWNRLRRGAENCSSGFKIWLFIIQLG